MIESIEAKLQETNSQICLIVEPNNFLHPFNIMIDFVSFTLIDIRMHQGLSITTQKNFNQLPNGSQDRSSRKEQFPKEVGGVST